MKRLTLILLLLLPVAAWGQTSTVSGHLLNPDGSAPTNAKVCFTLQNFSPNIPRISGTTTIVQQRNFCVAVSTVDGSFSTTLYENTSMTPTGTYWRVDYFYNGLQQSSANFLVNATTFNLDSATPLSTVPLAGPNQLQTQSFSCPQSSASTTWTCTHNFNDANVWVQTYDLNGVEIYPNSIDTSNSNVTTITWLNAQAGSARIFHAGSIAIATNQPNAILSNPTGAQTIQAGQNLTIDAATAFSAPIVSTVSTGTAPFSIASTTVVPNLNAQLHGGLSAPASAILGLTDVQSPTNKTFNVQSNTFTETTPTAGKYLRDNGASFQPSVIQSGDVPQINLAASGAGGVGGNLPVGNLNSGTNADSSHFWRGDGTWATVPASGVSEATVTGSIVIAMSSIAGITEFHLTNAHTITRLTVWTETSGATCSTLPQVNIQDQTTTTVLATVTMALSTAYTDSGALSVATTANHDFTINVSRAAVCTVGSFSNPHVTVNYQ